MEELLRKNNVAVYSSNYALYGDMSRRVTTTLGQMVPDLEVYSVDESFLDLSTFREADVPELCRKILSTVKRDTGIPVSVGVGPSKTLAKVATGLAKKHPSLGGFCDICDPVWRERALSSTEVGKIWGVGRRYKSFSRCGHQHGLGSGQR